MVNNWGKNASQVRYNTKCQRIGEPLKYTALLQRVRAAEDNDAYPHVPSHVMRAYCYALDVERCCAKSPEDIFSSELCFSHGWPSLFILMESRVELTKKVASP